MGKAIRIERKISQSNAMIETLAARVKLAAGDKAEAFDIYKEALKTFPQHRALIYDYADALLRHESAEAAIKFINQQLQFTPTTYAFISCRLKAMKRWEIQWRSIARRRKYIRGRAIIPLRLSNCRLR